MSKKAQIIVLAIINVCLLVAVAFLGIELKKAKNQEPVIIYEQDPNQQIEEKEPEVVYVEKEVEVVKYIEKQPEEETPVVTQTPYSSKKESKKDPTPAPEPEKKEMDYEEFINLTTAEQEAIIDSYSSLEDFLIWYYEVKAKYDEIYAPIVTDGNFNGN